MIIIWILKVSEWTKWTFFFCVWRLKNIINTIHQFWGENRENVALISERNHVFTLCCLLVTSLKFLVAYDDLATKIHAGEKIIYTINIYWDLKSFTISLKYVMFKVLKSMLVLLSFRITTNKIYITSSRDEKFKTFM